MTEREAIQARHSVRKYRPEAIPKKVIAELEEEIAACNREGKLHIQLVTGEKKAFAGGLAHYGGFSGVENYLALVGPEGPELEERCGYYGQRLVLLAQRLGLNTCWVALTFKKVKEGYTVLPGEKLCLVIALGYGENPGRPHKSKTPAQVAEGADGGPEWFAAGVEAALLAPTALNQQKFRFERQGDRVSVKAGRGPWARVDLGIVKYHFEVGAGKENFTWA